MVRVYIRSSLSEPLSKLKKALSSKRFGGSWKKEPHPHVTLGIVELLIYRQRLYSNWESRIWNSKIGRTSKIVWCSRFKSSSKRTVRISTVPITWIATKTFYLRILFPGNFVHYYGNSIHCTDFGKIKRLIMEFGLGKSY